MGVTMYFHSDITVQRKYANASPENRQNIEKTLRHQKRQLYLQCHLRKTMSLITAKFCSGWMMLRRRNGHGLFFIPVVIFIVTAVSNGANITDGIDGLAAGTSAIILSTLAFFAYLSGNIVFADYLNIMFLPNMGETTIFAIAMVGSSYWFLLVQYVSGSGFMGDTGSLMLGGVIAVLAIILRKELLIPVLCGVFLIELVSVMLQVAYFKYTKKNLEKEKEFS